MVRLYLKELKYSYLPVDYLMAEVNIFRKRSILCVDRSVSGSNVDLTLPCRILGDSLYVSLSNEEDALIIALTICLAFK